MFKGSSQLQWGTAAQRLAARSLCLSALPSPALPAGKPTDRPANQPTESLPGIPKKIHVTVPSLSPSLFCNLKNNNEKADITMKRKTLFIIFKHSSVA